MMTIWRPQHFRSEGLRRGISQEILENSVTAGRQVLAANPALPPILTLRHLAHETDVRYEYLREVATRREADPYKVFRIAKSISEPRKRNFRIICIPDPDLMKVQRWINQNILAHSVPHVASCAYSRGYQI